MPFFVANEYEPDAPTYGCAQTSAGNRDTSAGPLCVTASCSAAIVTESTAVPMWVVARPGADALDEDVRRAPERRRRCRPSLWLHHLVGGGPHRGVGDPPGRLVPAVVERAQEPRTCRLLPDRRRAPFHEALGRPSGVPSAPRCVAAAVTTSVTRRRRLGQ
jgi:hypothetical protein